MENNYNDGFVNDLKKEPARPQFLSVLCILTFIWSGFLSLIFLIGTFFLGISEETAEKMAERVMQSNPSIQIEDASQFFYQLGLGSLLYLLAKIAVLIGAVMMWKLNKIGFFIYVIAQAATYFIGLDVKAGEDDQSYGSTIFVIVIDLIFIAMYAMNLKYMNKNKTNPAV